MAVYDFRPWVPDIGYFIYWNWLPESLSNFWGYTNAEAQALGNEAITMAVDAPERHAKLWRFQEIINGCSPPILRSKPFNTCKLQAMCS
jgi:hypothetical protein